MRTFNVPLQPDRYTGKPGITKAAPTGTMKVANFLDLVFPGHKIEHLGRTEMLYTSQSGVHPTSLFFQAMLGCFENHYPMALSPDILAYLINHEVAVAVKNNPERYRHLFTTKVGKETIEVIDDTLVMGSPSNWGRTLNMFNPELRKRVPAGIMDRMLPGYSTDTPESIVATLISFMDAASPFYDYRVLTRCGIPQIRLLGTPEDWNRLLVCASGLAEVFQADLSAYFRHLLPVLKRIASQADPSNQADTHFWSSIYKWDSQSGGDTVTGWITAFVNYVKDTNGKLEPKRDYLYDWETVGWGGIDSGAFATHVSNVPFVWKYYGVEYNMSFLGGVMGIDNDEGFVRPVLSYAVAHGGQHIDTIKVSGKGNTGLVL